jgi:phage shock protein C
MTTQPTTGVDGDRTGIDDSRRLYRSRSNRVLTGVCGGIAEFYGADARAVRLLAIIVALFTGIFPMILVYLIAAVVLPEHGTPVAPGTPAGAGELGIILGGLLIIVGAVGMATVWLQVSWDVVWPVALVCLGALTLALALRGRHGTA